VPGDTDVVNIGIGGVFASGRPTEVRTVLGSCVAVCLFDPEVAVGGMNHFMLPFGDDEREPGKYGEHAMDLLIGAMQRLGASRSRLRAKLFGGGHVLHIPDRSDSVARKNVLFVEGFMADEGIVVVSKSLGGTQPRQVRFRVSSGQAYVRFLRDRGVEVPERAPAAAPIVRQIEIFR
jgi:chemotaxis receptor (MCP) glutamine deamidase CheD